MELAQRVEMVEEVVHIVHGVDHLVQVAHHLGPVLGQLHAGQLTVLGLQLLEFGEQR